MIPYFLGLALVALVTCGHLVGLSLVARRFYRRTQASWSAPHLIWIGFVAAFGLLGLGASLSSVAAVYALMVSATNSQQSLAITPGNVFVTGLVVLVVGFFAVFFWLALACFASFRLPASPRVPASFRVPLLVMGGQPRRPPTTRQMALFYVLSTTNVIGIGFSAGLPLHSWQIGVVTGVLTAIIFLVTIQYFMRAR